MYVWTHKQLLPWIRIPTRLCNGGAVVKYFYWRYSYNMTECVIDHIPETFSFLRSVCVLRRDRVKATDNCKALVKCRRLVPLGPLSHSWHPAGADPLQHAWGVLSHAVPLIRCHCHIMSRSPLALWAQGALDCIETENKQINKTKGEGGQREKGCVEQTGVSICSELSAFELWNDSTHNA